VYRLTTRLGRSIRATGNHKFLAFEGWTRLDHLTKGARIALPRVLPEQARATMRRDELALLGHLIGDGCVLARHATQYTTREPELACLVAQLASSVFGDEVRPRVARERAWYQVYLAAGARLARGRRNPVAAWLDGLGVGNLRSHEKRVPEQVFRQPRAEIGLFLRHLWATDGCLYYNASATVPISVYYASSSERLARDVQSLLLRLGINAVLTRSPQHGKGRDQYHVQVMGKPDLELFSLLVGAVGERRTAALGAIRAHQQARVANTNRDVIPRAAWRSPVLPAMQRTGMTTRAMHTAIRTRYCGTSLYKANMGRDRAARVAAAVDSHELALLAQSDVYWDEVVSIVPNGEEEVYDLTVDGLHNFVADGVVVHNSIEQDADVVMFIYREELYNPQTDKKNIAEIHVSKHRNGPVGIVPLRFFRDTTRFADLESMRQPE
jgi:replicative DNA helicase